MSANFPSVVELRQRNDSSKLTSPTNHLLLQSAHADPKTGYDNARYYTMTITASQFSKKPQNAVEP